jgi:hypothetical protein
MRLTDPFLCFYRNLRRKIDRGKYVLKDVDLSFGFSSPTPDAAHSPTNDEACGEYDEKDDRPGCGDGPGQKGDIHVLHVLEDEDQRQNPESDA